MRHSTAAPRLALWKVAAALGTAIAASLALAAGAQATVYTAYASPTGGELSLATAIADANANTAQPNTIVLTTGKYQPSTGMTITGGNLTITNSSHADQVPATGAVLDGTTQQTQSPSANFITVNAGATLTIDAITIQAAGNNGASPSTDAIADNGTLYLNGDLLSTETGVPVNVASGATFNMTDSTIDSTLHTDSIDNAGTMTLTNDTLSNGQQGAIVNSGNGTFTLYNSLLAFQSGIECSGGVTQGGTTGASNDGSMDDDGSCGVQYSDDTNILNNIPQSGVNGGPTDTVEMPPGSDTVGKGNSSKCPTVDQRFYVNPKSGSTITCDVGAVTNAATKETAAQGPVCGQPTIYYPPGYPNDPNYGTNAANTASETVPVSDSYSGLGPENGGPGDVLNPWDSIAGVVNSTNTGTGGISNGSVAVLNPFTGVSTSTSENVEAMKATQGTVTAWSFTATDWAGQTKYCN